MVNAFVFIGLFISAVYVNTSLGLGSEPTLPPEPSLPTAVCSTLTAKLTQVGGLLPDSVDTSPDTSRLQAALNTCQAGHAVKLSADNGKNAFLSGPLTLPSGVTLWIDKSVTLFASRNPRDFDNKPGENICGTISNTTVRCVSFITANNTKNSGLVGDGIIDGRGGSKLIEHNVSWWDIAMQAKLQQQNPAHPLQHNPRLIMIINSSNFTLYRITVQNAPNFHVLTIGVNGFIAWGVKIHTPTAVYPSYNASTTKNTDGIDPDGSSNVIIAYSYISTGDDNVAIKTDSGPSSNIIIAHNHFYKGHGMSIGSSTSHGVSNVLVYNLTLDGADNGLRIKSDSTHGGLVTNIKYSQVCIRNVDMPITFDAYYSSSTGTLYPNFENITVSDVHILSSTKRQLALRGYNAEYPLKVTFDNVISDLPLDHVTASDAYITEGPGAVTNLPIKASSASNVKLYGTPGKSTPVDCSDVFVPFPS
jgi:polygalacturonase